MRCAYQRKLYAVGSLTRRSPRVHKTKVTDRSFHYNEDGPVQRGVLTSWMLSLTTMGGLQVDVFFVLSGFLLCRTMRKCSPQDARDGLKSFVLLRRFVRLATLPALYIAFMYLVGLNRLSVEQVADQLSLSMVYLNKRVTSELLPMWSNHADFYQQLVVGSALQLFIARIGRLAEHCEAASALLVGIALCGVALRQLQYSRGSSIMGGLNALVSRPLLVVAMTLTRPGGKHV